MRLSTAELKAIIDIIGVIHSAPTRAAVFRSVCEKLNRLIGICGAIFAPASAARDGFRLKGYELFNASESAMLAYLSNYAGMDPFVMNGLKAFANNTARITDLVPAGLLRESEFGADFLIPVANVFYILGSTLVCEGDSVGVFALHRAMGDADFSERDRAIVNQLLPHMARAMRDAEMLKTVIVEEADPGLIMTGEGGRTLFMNDEARQILGKRPVSSIPVVGQGPAFLKDGPVSYRVRTLPGADGKGRMILLERDPPEVRLRPALGGWNLTRREEEVATLAIQGMSNAEIARRLFVAEQTVKDHLKEIFGKAGVKKRSALAAKALGLGPNDDENGA